MKCKVNIKKIMLLSLMCLFFVYIIAIVNNISMGSSVPVNKHVRDVMENEKLYIEQKTVNDNTYDMIAHDEVRFEWKNGNSSVSEFDFYQYHEIKNMYELYATIDDPNTTSINVRRLKPETEYKFKIIAKDKSGMEVWSDICSIITKDIASGFFCKQVVWNKEWSNILITEEAATDEMMNSYSLEDKKPFVKYNYSICDRTLYIHTYLDFSGKALNDYFVPYVIGYNNTNHAKTRATSYTYKDIIKSAIEEYWSIPIEGDVYDFSGGCNFNTQIVLHEIGSYDQSYIHVFVGSNGQKKEDDKYWYFVKNACLLQKDVGQAEYNYAGNDVSMHISTNEQVDANESTINIPCATVKELKQTIAHEFAHCLGLADAYSYVRINPMRYAERSHKTTETGYFENGEYEQLMFESHSKGTRVMDNDVEMAIHAQAMAYKGMKNSWQTFADHEYEINGVTYYFKQSPMIRSEVE